jgi:hypothetical protein
MSDQSSHSVVQYEILAASLADQANWENLYQKEAAKFAILLNSGDLSIRFIYTSCITLLWRT